MCSSKKTLNIESYHAIFFKVYLFWFTHCRWNHDGEFVVNIVNDLSNLHNKTCCMNISSIYILFMGFIICDYLFLKCNIRYSILRYWYIMDIKTPKMHKNCYTYIVIGKRWWKIDEHHMPIRSWKKDDNDDDWIPFPYNVFL